MQPEIHPTYNVTTVTCGCGNEFVTRSTAAGGAIRTDVCSAYAEGVPPTFVNVPRPSDIGFRTFDKINATMAAVTGVSSNTAAVKSTYTNIRQSLPAVDSIEAFLSSHQTAIAQLAIQYCGVMVDDNTVVCFGNMDEALAYIEH